MYVNMGSVIQLSWVKSWEVLLLGDFSCNSLCAVILRVKTFSTRCLLQGWFKDVNWRITLIVMVMPAWCVCGSTMQHNFINKSTDNFFFTKTDLKGSICLIGEKEDLIMYRCLLFKLCNLLSITNPACLLATDSMHLNLTG